MTVIKEIRHFRENWEVSPGFRIKLILGIMIIYVIFMAAAELFEVADYMAGSSSQTVVEQQTDSMYDNGDILKEFLYDDASIF